MMCRSAFLTMGFALMATACQTLPGMAAAKVNLDDRATRAAVISVLSVAVGRAQITLGPVTENTAVISVLPPPLGPYETHSTALPIQFDIQKQGNKCLAIRRDTHEVFELTGVDCKP